MREVRHLHILGISGSLRRGSFNTELLRVADRVSSEGVSVHVADISDLPLYNADVERALGFPLPVERFRDEIEAADALLFATPEYNFSVTGALKNAIDWASRSPSPLDHMPAAMLGTGGRSGTAGAQNHLRDILRHNDLRVITSPELVIPGAWSKFDDEGRLTDDVVAQRVRDLVTALQQAVEGSNADDRSVVAG